MDPRPPNGAELWHLLMETNLVDEWVVRPKIIAQDFENGQGALTS